MSALRLITSVVAVALTSAAAAANAAAAAAGLDPAATTTTAATTIITTPPITTTRGEVTFFLKQARAAELTRAFVRVSDPASAEWGAFLSHEEVLELQRPLGEHVAMVERHLAEIGATGVRWSTARDKVVATVTKMTTTTTTAARAEPAEDEGVSSLLLLLLPDKLRAAVDFVADNSRPRALVPTAAPMKQRSSRARARSPSSPATTATNPQDCLFDRAIPPCIRTAYGVNSTAATFSGFNAQAVIVNEGFKPSDLAHFEREHGLPAQPIAETVGPLPGEAGDEATLDVQFVIAMGQRVPTWWVYIDGHVANPFASWLTWASNTSAVPLVHSLSVGEPERDFAKQNGGEACLARMNDEFAALGARGLTLVFASGDSGCVFFAIMHSIHNEGI